MRNHQSISLDNLLSRASINIKQILFLLLISPLVMGQIRHLTKNAGAVLLNHAFVAPEPTRRHTFASLAEETLQFSVSWMRGDRSSWRMLGYAFDVQGERIEAGNAWRTAGRMSQEFIEFGKRARRDKDYSESFVRFQQGRITYPGLGDWWYHEGVTFRELGEYDHALRALQNALKAPLVDVGESDIYFAIGSIWFLDNDRSMWAIALDSFNAAIREDQFIEESRVTAYYYRAEVLRQSGRYEDAITDYLTILKVEPDHYLANLRLGNLLWQRRGDEEEAERLLRHAIAVDPTVKWAFRSLATLYHETGRVDEALLLYEHVVELDPQDQGAYQQIEQLKSGER